MKEDIYSQTGIYIAYPTSSVLKSIYRQKKYKTLVNDKHTKVGIAKDSFKSRENGYLVNFDREVVFMPLAIIVDIEKLKCCEYHILSALKREFSKRGRAREWFDTNNHQRVKEIVAHALSSFGITHEYIG